MKYYDLEITKEVCLILLIIKLLEGYLNKIIVNKMNKTLQ